MFFSFAALILFKLLKYKTLHSKKYILHLFIGEMVAQRLDQAMAKYGPSNQEGNCATQFWGPLFMLM